MSLFKRPDKYAKRPEFIDVDNAIRNPKQYRGEYVKNLPGVGVTIGPIAASASGKMGGRPLQGMVQAGGPVGNATPVQTRNRLSPNKLEEHQ